MSDIALTVIEVLLIPAALLPIVTAFVIRRYRNSDSQALRDRWHLALVLALLGFVTAMVAAMILLDIQNVDVIWIAFGLVLLAVDVVSGKWLYDYSTGGFEERAGGGPETAIEHEDRIVGDKRRKLQADAAEQDEEAAS